MQTYVVIVQYSYVQLIASQCDTQEDVYTDVIKVNEMKQILFGCNAKVRAGPCTA